MKPQTYSVLYYSASQGYPVSEQEVTRAEALRSIASHSKHPRASLNAVDSGEVFYARDQYGGIIFAVRTC
jgi:hypothetical protein